MKPTGATTSAELCGADKGIVKTVGINCLTPTHCHHDINIHRILHCKRVSLTSIVPYQLDLMLADPNTKSHNGNNVKTKIDQLIGVKYYPPSGTEHYDILFNNHKARTLSKSDTSKSSQSPT
eukprot:1091954-Ditylum_brightwellii.AAC.1